MKASLCPGLSKVARIKIDRDRTISFMGEEGRVYSTPNLLRDIEHTCRELLLEHSDAGEESVGMDVTIQHLAPTLLGMTVEITVTITAVDRRKISFDVSIKDDIEPVAKAAHTRFVVDIAKQVERLKAKAVKRDAR